MTAWTSSSSVHEKRRVILNPANAKSGFHNMQGIPWLAEKLLVYQKETCSAELDRSCKILDRGKVAVLNEVPEVPNNDEVMAVDLWFHLFLTSALEKLQALVSDGYMCQMLSTRITRFVAVRNCRYVYYTKLWLLLSSFIFLLTIYYL